MSRLKRFTHSLVSGYILLGANMLFTLASVPLALHYLSTPEFGLWALVSQLGGYISLIDLGMSSSVARILIDHKDDRQTGAYGSVIKTGALVGVVQGVLILVAGIGL
jgi:O-antigen/teichoic acid export membrane protein